MNLYFCHALPVASSCFSVVFLIFPAATQWLGEIQLSQCCVYVCFRIAAHFWDFYGYIVSGVFSKREHGNLNTSRYVIHLTQINCLDNLIKTMYTLCTTCSALCTSVLLFVVPAGLGKIPASCQCMYACFDVSALFYFSTSPYNDHRYIEIFAFKPFYTHFSFSCNICPHWFVISHSHRCVLCKGVDWRILFVCILYREKETRKQIKREKQDALEGGSLSTVFHRPMSCSGKSTVTDS